MLFYIVLTVKLCLSIFIHSEALDAVYLSYGRVKWLLWTSLFFFFVFACQLVVLPLARKKESHRYVRRACACISLGLV